MKNILFLIIIVILVIGIGVTQYQLFNIDKNNIETNSGQVKSATINLSNNSIPELDTQIINPIPKPVDNFKKADIWAYNYILLDVDSAYPLAEKDSQASVPIASTTKIMSAIIVLENYNLEDVVTVSSNAATQIGSDVQLRTNETLTVESLLHALLIKSGNDAAMALAEFYNDGGSDGFVVAMNKKAQYLELHNTQFKDPAGLNDEGKSTAFDLAILTAYALKNPIFEKIVRIPEITIHSTDGRQSHILENSNRLIKPNEPLFYPDAIGVKTGFTPDAGHCLVAAAEKNGKKLVSIILHTYEDTIEASAKENKKLLLWGFENYHL